jgi:hypothetical protein
MVLHIKYWKHKTEAQEFSSAILNACWLPVFVETCSVIWSNFKRVLERRVARKTVNVSDVQQDAAL